MFPSHLIQFCIKWYFHLFFSHIHIVDSIIDVPQFPPSLPNSYSLKGESEEKSAEASGKAVNRFKTSCGLASSHCFLSREGPPSGTKEWLKAFGTAVLWDNLTVLKNESGEMQARKHRLWWFREKSSGKAGLGLNSPCKTLNMLIKPQVCSSVK